MIYNLKCEIQLIQISYNCKGDKLKKFFQILGLVTLIGFSFFYTEKVGYVVREMDILMEEIKQKSADKKIDPINAIITENTIIPGKNGKEVDIEESYKKMKRINEYNENMLVYKKIKPEVSLKNNYDKYIISGSKTENKVSIILIVNEKTDINYLRNLAKEKNIKFNFFVDSIWFENNNELLSTLINEGHNIGNLGQNGNYNTSTYIWMDTILKKIVKQKNNYCYLEAENKEYLEICALNKNYTIKPSIVIKEKPTNNLKKQIENGSIISIEANTNVIKELNVAINYIINKGYKIVSLNNL